MLLLQPQVMVVPGVTCAPWARTAKTASVFLVRGPMRRAPQGQSPRQLAHVLQVGAATQLACLKYASLACLPCIRCKLHYLQEHVLLPRSLV
jgi:hypothetical protein